MTLCFLLLKLLLAHRSCDWVVVVVVMGVCVMEVGWRGVGVAALAVI